MILLLLDKLYEKDSGAFINFIIFVYNHLRLFYYKWIRRRCRHFCLLCSHKDWCIKDVGILQVINEFKEELKYENKSECSK